MHLLKTSTCYHSVSLYVTAVLPQDVGRWRQILLMTELWKCKQLHSAAIAGWSSVASWAALFLAEAETFFPVFPPGEKQQQGNLVPALPAEGASQSSHPSPLGETFGVSCVTDLPRANSKQWDLFQVADFWPLLVREKGILEADC